MNVVPQQWPHPSGCQCGCGGNWGCDDGRNLMQCWSQINQLKCDTVNTGPIKGVVDGSDAKPGDVGEFVRLITQTTYPATATTQMVTSGVLPPGDWDCWVSANTSSFVTDVSFVQSPVPAGFSDELTALVGVNAGQEAVTIVSAIVRGSVSVPTLISFRVTTNNGGTGGSGTLQLIFAARRMR